MLCSLENESMPTEEEIEKRFANLLVRFIVIFFDIFLLPCLRTVLEMQVFLNIFVCIQMYYFLSEGKIDS